MATMPALIRQVKCFDNLSDEQIDMLAEISNVVCYPPKHIIFEEGVIGRNLYFLLKGEVEILFNLGKDELSRIDMKFGETLMGCSALMEPFMYAATNRSVSEVEVLEINVAKLRELMEQDCKLGMAIQAQMINFMREYILKLRGHLY